MRRRALRLLDAGRAPLAWLRDAERAGARLHALERGAAWAPVLAAVRPALREGPLLGGALHTLASADVRPSSSPDPDAVPAALPAPARRGAPPSSPRRAAARAARAAEGADAPPDAAPRPRTPRERRAAAAPDVAHHRPRLAQLPRRADEGLLRRWSADAEPARGGAARSASTKFGASHGARPAATADAFEWDAFVRRASRAVLAASPDSLPMLGVADRLRGWRDGGSPIGAPAAPPLELVRRMSSADAAELAEAGGSRWIGTVARRASRRFLRTAGVAAGGSIGGRGMDFRDPHRPRLADAADAIRGGDPHPHGARGVESADPHRPLLADAADAIRGGGAHRHDGGTDSTDPHRPLLADDAGWMDGGDPHRPWLADAADGGLSISPPLALEWGAPLDGPAAPADVLARLANGLPRRPAGQGSAGDSTRRAPAESAASLLRQARREAAGTAGGPAEGDAPSASPASPLSAGVRRGHRAPHVPALVRAPAERGAADGAASSPVRAISTAHGVLRPSARPLLAPGASARQGTAAAEAFAEDGGDRWMGWPAVLPWPRGPRAVPADESVARAASARPANPSIARPRRSADAAGGEGPGAPLAASPAPDAEGTPRGPIATPSALYRPNGPLPPPMTPGPFPPRAPVPAETLDRAGGEAARPPAPLASGEDAAPWAEGWGAPLQGPHAAAHPFAPDAGRAAEALDDDLARRLKRILDDEARRYGIDV